MSSGNRSLIVGFIVGIISIIVLSLLWISSIGGFSNFKPYYFSYLTAYFVLLVFDSWLIGLLLNRVKRARIILGMIHGVWLSVILAILSTIVIMFVEISKCTGTHCGELGMGAPVVLALMALVFLIPNITLGFIDGMVR
jgi:magnesium-transporting ATPase (P-type)